MNIVPGTSIYCIGRNYDDHAKELGNDIPAEPVVFLKTASSARGLNPEVKMAFKDETFDHEIELVLRIAENTALQTANNIAISHITLGLDLTRRDTQSKLKAKGLPWTTAKSFSGSAVLAPWIVATNLQDLQDLSFSLTVNGEERQVGHCKDMLFPPQTLLKYLNSFNDLRAGDIVFTGTPQGVGPIRCGDTFVLKMMHPVVEMWNVSFSGGL